jgi:hypothetical protein
MHKKIAKKLDHPHVSKAFHYISKGVILIPVLVVIAALILYARDKYIVQPREQIKEQNRQLQLERANNQSSLSITPAQEKGIMALMQGIQGKKSGVDSLDIDLKTSRSCDFSSEKNKIMASIKDEKIYVEIKPKEQTTSKTEQNISQEETIDKNIVSKIVYVDDCIYDWQEGSKSGSKICDIASVLSMLNSLSIFGGEGINTDVVFSMISDQTGIKLGTGAASLKDLEKNCQKSKVDEDLFNIPKEIQFEEISLGDLS